MANQIFLTLGAEKYGVPATAEKSRLAIQEFLAEKGLPTFYVEEGSGISRLNSLSASQMIEVLKVFLPYRDIMNQEDSHFVKTGTMIGVRTLAGYIQRNQDKVLNFAILLNGPSAKNGAREKILQLLEQNLN